MRRRAGLRVLAPAALALALVVVACSPQVEPVPPEAPVPASPEPVPRLPTAPGSAYAALRELCDRPGVPREEPVRAAGELPPAIDEVRRGVERVRGLRFREPVTADPVSQPELVRRLRRSFQHSFPSRLYRRRSLAWSTIGVIAPGASLRRELHEFYSGQVVGFYVPTSGELVFIGSERPTPLERVVLAHELTHALDDQHFDLDRLDRLEARCRDERLEAALGVVEGSAQYFSLLYAQRFLSLEEQLGLGAGEVPQAPDVEPFVARLELWPYAAGAAFVAARAALGGRRAVDQALRHLPVSTEQVIHPERYPNDAPRLVDVPDLADALGPGWRDLDVMEVGEAWLQTMLGLRLDGATARAAAAGWDGGLYRAWARGRDVAVVLETAWDREADAAGFARALRSWIGDRQPAEVLWSGARVTALFASDAGTLGALRAALGRG
ncbi:MAG TPA: hypothetical protein VNO79_07055 [Actinomycetota bacterium]|nr:hypothetical protein [Actinomycetota bacterium]